MKIIIKATNLKLNQAIESYVEKKIGSLEKFLKIFQNNKYYNDFFGKGKPKMEAWIEIGRSTLHHRKGAIFCAEAQMRLPKMSIRSEAKAEDLKTAITQVKDELQEELKKYKEKMTALTKRKDRAFKKELKLSPAAKPPLKSERIREEGI